MDQSGSKVGTLYMWASYLLWRCTLSVSTGGCLSVVCKLFIWIKLLLSLHHRLGTPVGIGLVTVRFCLAVGRLRPCFSTNHLDIYKTCQVKCLKWNQSWFLPIPNLSHLSHITQYLHPYRCSGMNCGITLTLTPNIWSVSTYWLCLQNISRILFHHLITLLLSPGPATIIFRLISLFVPIPYPLIIFS